MDSKARRHPPWYFWPVLATGLSLLLFAYKYLGSVGAGQPTPVLKPLVEEVTGVWTAMLLLPLAVYAARRFPLDQAGWYRRLPIHLVCAMAFGVAHTSAMWGSRLLLFPAMGLGPLHYGPEAYGYELPLQTALYSLVVAGTYVWDRHRAARERELRISQLETELVRARLDALRMQINPHFLFNALNTVSDTMYRDVEAADTMLAGLADLLRRTMADTAAHEVRLAEELELLELYLGIMRHRFQDRLETRTSVESGVEDALVPSMVLQPLVENALEHGGVGTGPEPLVIEIGAHRAGDRLRLRVRDGGRGAPGSGEGLVGPGIGLTNTVERLRKLYGAEHRFETRNVPGGFLVEMEIPYRSAVGVPTGSLVLTEGVR